jgi:alpha-glucosidase (family GH31 glycosyl hydrolase)
MAMIRQRTVKDIIEKSLDESLNEGLPLVRPLWMLDPHDAACLSVVDEFSIGEEIIVAPILEKGKTVREGNFIKLSFENIYKILISFSLLAVWRVERRN